MYLLSHILKCNQTEIHRELIVPEECTMNCFTGKPVCIVSQHIIIVVLLLALPYKLTIQQLKVVCALQLNNTDSD